MSKQTMVIPDLGGVDQVTVLEVLVAIGDDIQVDQALMSLESEKASMDVPSDRVGRVVEVLLKPGDVVKEGDPCLVVDSDSVASPAGVKTEDEQREQVSTAAILGSSAVQKPAHKADMVLSQAPDVSQARRQAVQGEASLSGQSSVYATPAVRQMARKLGLDLAQVVATGRHGRVTLDDIAATVQARMEVMNQQPAPPVASSPWVDPTKFGECSEKALNKIKKATAAAMKKAHDTVVPVTQCELVDITELEQYRKQHKDTLYSQQQVRLTMLAFVIKALGQTLQAHPSLNASYQEERQVLWQKHYCHVGVAVDTPQGLVVPVVRDVVQLSVIDIAIALRNLSQKAREGVLLPKDMAGGSFTVSSLGGIGGTYFTPVVNVPQTAILGISRASLQPVWDGKQFAPRLMLPLSLSYDHRVIDGAEAMRFINDYSENLRQIVDIALDQV